MPFDARVELERLCSEHRVDFASLSKMLGRNPAYIQQFVRRGIPRKLGEEDRGKLAAFFGVPEILLGGPANSAASILTSVFQRPIQVAAGEGMIGWYETGKPYFGFDPQLLKQLTKSKADALSIVRVKGDSMSPTLNDEDDILVDHGDFQERGVRDGIYVIRVEDLLVVKRIAINPMRRTVTVQSDNPAYADWPDCAIESINFIGRVIWAARKLA